jgi:hypothetical protein
VGHCPVVQPLRLPVCDMNRRVSGRRAAAPTSSASSAETLAGTSLRPPPGRCGSPVAHGRAVSYWTLSPPAPARPRPRHTSGWRMTKSFDDMMRSQWFRSFSSSSSPREKSSSSRPTIGSVLFANSQPHASWSRALCLCVCGYRIDDSTRPWI